ncbi:hypothetical protein MKX03_033545 [Papaver bracteatum]|nr:hypothetical protein MKX03_033545 [Papaver bracteatum]
MANYTQTDRYFDRSSLKVAEGRNKADSGVSAIKDNKWVKRYFDNLTVKVVPKMNKPPVGKGMNNSGAPVTWIDRYFSYLSSRVAYDGSPKQIMYPRSEFKEPSIDLQSSLKMFFQEAACDADDWTDVHTKYNDRRSFSAFLDLLEPSGLEKYASNEGRFQHDDINIRYPQERYWSPHKVSPDVVVANKYYDGSFSLMRLLQRIRSESDNDFSREQAGLLVSFLDHLVKIQQEQRFAAYTFSWHLEQLRKFDVDVQTCNLVRSGDVGYCIWCQKHLVDSLCIMSRKSAWLLKQLKDSPFTSPSSIEESNKILDIILAFSPKFVKSKKWLDRYLLRIHSARGSPFQLISRNNEMLDRFGGCIKSLQEQGVERNSVAKTLLGCFVNVVNMYYNLAELGDPFGDTCSSLQGSFSEAAKETSELINGAVDKLNSVRCSDLTGGGSPLGCIALWRILFESSLINLRLDFICKNHRETIKLGDKQSDTATNDQLDQIRQSINKLFTVGEIVLVEFIDMHKTVAEVTYMLGDAFTTGGAGMRGSSDVTHPGTSSKHGDQVMDFNPDDFPWDKHIVPSATIGPNRKLPKHYEGYSLS